MPWSRLSRRPISRRPTGNIPYRPGSRNAAEWRIDVTCDRCRTARPRVPGEHSETRDPGTGGERIPVLGDSGTGSTQVGFTRLAHATDLPILGRPEIGCLVPLAVLSSLARDTLYDRPMSGSYFVYILASKRNGTLYVGVTNDLVRRMSEHKAKLVPGFTRRYGVDKLVYFEEYASILEARAKLEALAAGLEARADRENESRMARSDLRIGVVSNLVSRTRAARAGTQVREAQTYCASRFLRWVPGLLPLAALASLARDTWIVSAERKASEPCPPPCCRASAATIRRSSTVRR